MTGSDATGTHATGTDATGTDLADPPGVLTALSRLEGLEVRPVAEHVEVFDEVHRLLQDALATLDEA